MFSITFDFTFQQVRSETLEPPFVLLLSSLSLKLFEIIVLQCSSWNFQICVQKRTEDRRKTHTLLIISDWKLHLLFVDVTISRFSFYKISQEFQFSHSYENSTKFLANNFVQLFSKVKKHEENVCVWYTPQIVLLQIVLEE